MNVIVMIGVHPLNPLTERFEELGPRTSGTWLGPATPCQMDDHKPNLFAFINCKQDVVAILC
jgi:hypothetical protein